MCYLTEYKECWSAIKLMLATCPLLPSLLPVKGTSKNVRLVVSPLWRGQRNKWATAQTLNELAVSDMRITASAVLCTCSLTTIACGWWSLVTNQGEVARRFSEQLSSWRYALTTITALTVTRACLSPAPYLHIALFSRAFLFYVCGLSLGGLTSRK